MTGRDPCNAIEQDLRQGRFGEARAQAERLVQTYPGHLRGLFLLAVALLRLREPQKARLHLDTALGLDPENAECRLALAECFRQLGEKEQAARQFVRAFALFPSERDIALVLDGQAETTRELKAQGETSPLGRANRFKMSVNWGGALPEFQAITHSDPFLPEAWLGLAETLWRLGRLQEAMSTLDQIAVAWPNFVKAKLIAGDILIRQGQVEAGTAYLHNAQALDPSGLVAERTLREPGYYSRAWSGRQSQAAQNQVAKMAHTVEAEIDEEFPPAPTSEPPAAASPSMHEIAVELNRLRDHLCQVEEKPKAQATATVSALAILTCRSALEEKYGSEFVERLGEQTRALIAAIGPQHDRAIHYVDLSDPEQMSGLGAHAPENPADPTQVKAAIDSLADGLLAQGTDLRHILILGGDDIVPFFRVANPTDDDDEDIYTDAPYSARNGSHLLPTRAVGRLPDSGDPDGFLRLVERAATAHDEANQAEPASPIKAISRLWKREKTATVAAPSFGYTASVWKEASRAVFDAIGEAKHLRMCPPVSHREFAALVNGQPRFAYFNLHGVEGDAAWYGQRDPEFAADYPLFPVALLPEGVTADRAHGAIVFTEACYGADIFDHTADDSIAVKFLAEGARAVVGSTRLAYGSLTPPLAGADLLGQFFWLAVQSGMPIGQALQWAKLSFADDVMKRQGYLDSEDQKTLLTFNLLGDPTLTALGQAPIWDKLPRSALASKSPVVCCSHGSRAMPLPDLPSGLYDHVQEEIAHRVPWLTAKQIKVFEQVVCSNGACNGSCQHTTAEETARKTASNRYVFTVNGTLASDANNGWPQIVKVTVDGKGTILKMAVSK